MSGPTLRVAYLVSEYPAVSHVFVEREVRGLRDAGAEVVTFSVRRTVLADRLSEASRAEAAGTSALLDRSIRATARTLLRMVARRPAGVLRALRTALRSGAPTPRGRLWQLFYLAESMLLVEEMDAAALTHVHAHFANNAADVARLAARLGGGAGKRWTWTFSMHGPTEFIDPIGHDLAAKVRSADGVACISAYCRDSLRRITGEAMSAERLPIVRMTVDAETFRPLPRDVSDEGSVRVLFVGRLVPEKGPLDLVAALAAVRERGHRIEVRIAGSGPLRDAVGRAVSAAGLSDVVELLGPVGQERVVELYRWADVFCLPSHAEGVPVVLMEAMATELPVVTSPVGGIPELVRDRESGLLVEPGDVAGLAKALGDLIETPELRRRLGEQARKDVVSEFTPGRNTTRLVEFLRAAQDDR